MATIDCRCAGPDFDEDTPCPVPGHMDHKQPCQRLIALDPMRRCGRAWHDEIHDPLTRGAHVFDAAPAEDA